MQLKYHMIIIEDLVPEDHFLRKLDAALDLSFVYKETYPLYNHRIGRLSILIIALLTFFNVRRFTKKPKFQVVEDK